MVSMMNLSLLLDDLVNTTEKIFGDAEISPVNTTEQPPQPPPPTVPSGYATDFDALLFTTTIYSTLFTTSFLLFCILRLRYPHAYNIRKYVPPHRTFLADDQHGFLSWIKHNRRPNDATIMNECGLDALCTFRLLDFGVSLSFVGILNSWWLVPVYATAVQSSAVAEAHALMNATTTGSMDDVLRRLTATDIPPGDLRLIATAVAAWVIFGYAMRHIYLDVDWYISRRHEFMSRSLCVQSYAVYVSGIPQDCREDEPLAEWFRGVFSEEAVRSAHVALFTPALERMVARREGALWDLEHEIAVYERRVMMETDESRRRSLTGALMGFRGLFSEAEDDRAAREIERLNDELVELNRSISKAIEDIATIHKEYNQERSLQRRLSIMQYSQRHMMQMISDGDDIDDDARDAEENEEDEATLSLLQTAAATAVLTDVAGNVTEATERMKTFFTGTKDGTPKDSGFVVFNKLSTTHGALQMIHDKKWYIFNVSAAPSPNEIIWRNVGKSIDDVKNGRSLAMTLTAFLCLFWTIPVTFVTGIANVEHLRTQLPALDDLIRTYPRLEKLFDQLAPVLIALLNVLLPMILEGFSELEWPISTSQRTSSLFNKLAIFNIIQTFFIISLSGSGLAITGELQALSKDPWKIVDLLANSLPGMSTFYIQILLAETALSQTVEMLRISDLTMAFLRSYIGPNVTEKERRRTWSGLRPLADPKEHQSAYRLGVTVLYFTVLLIYSCLAPLTSYFLFVCFFIHGICLRHQRIYIYPKEPDSGGKIYENNIKILISCMVIAEVTLMGFLSLKKSGIAVAMTAPLIFLTVKFGVDLRNDQFRIAENLTSRECAALDSKRYDECDDDDDERFDKDAYRQPELIMEELMADNWDAWRETRRLQRERRRRHDDDDDEQGGDVDNKERVTKGKTTKGKSVHFFEPEVQVEDDITEGHRDNVNGSMQGLLEHADDDIDNDEQKRPADKMSV